MCVLLALGKSFRLQSSFQTTVFPCQHHKEQKHYLPPCRLPIDRHNILKKRDSKGLLFLSHHHKKKELLETFCHHRGNHLMSQSGTQNLENDIQVLSSLDPIATKRTSQSRKAGRPRNPQKPLSHRKLYFQSKILYSVFIKMCLATALGTSPCMQILFDRSSPTTKVSFYSEGALSFSPPPNPATWSHFTEEKWQN